MQKQGKNKKRIDLLLNHLSKKERDDFLKEILNASLSGDDILRIIIDWEATAEINSNPPLKRRILSRAKQLEKYLLQNNG